MSILSKVVGLIARNGEAGGNSAYVAVMSPLTERAGERETVLRLFAAGLSAYHLRRPSWSPARCREWLLGLPEKARSRIVLERHPQLVRRHGLLGFHVTAGTPVPAAGTAGVVSAQCEDLQAMVRFGGSCRRLMLGPVFPPEKYDVTVPRRTPQEYAAIADYWRRRGRGGASTEIIAFGGVNASNARLCREAGFDGIVVAGAVWNAPDPVKAFKTLMREW